MINNQNYLSENGEKKENVDNSDRDKSHDSSNNKNNENNSNSNSQPKKSKNGSLFKEQLQWVLKGDQRDTDIDPAKLRQ